MFGDGGCDCSGSPTAETVDTATPLVSHDICYKCKLAPSEVLSRGLSSCRQCFRMYVESNVRSALRLKCATTRGTRVAVCVSGGQSSLALLHILMGGQMGIMERWNKTLGLDIQSLIHVDLARIFDEDLVQLRQWDITPLVKEEMLGSDVQSNAVILEPNPMFQESISSLPFLSRTASQVSRFLSWCVINPVCTPIEVISPLELAFPVSWVKRHSEESIEGSIDDPIILIKQCFQSLASSIFSSRELKDAWVLEDLLDIVRDRALLIHSLKLNANHSRQTKVRTKDDPLVFLFGQSGSRLASQSFEALCKGGGVRVPLLASSVDHRYSKWNTTFARPMKKLTDDEINEYLKITVMQNDSPFEKGSTDQQISSLPSRRADVNFLVSDFLTKLQSTNSQSTSTVVQTLDKLGSRGIARTRRDGVNDSAACSGEKNRGDQKTTLGLETLGHDHGDGTALFKFGWCRCCLGPLEPLSSKEGGWSRKQLEILSTLDESTSSLFNHLCLSCIRLAAAFLSSAQIVKLLMMQHSAFSSLF